MAIIQSILVISCVHADAIPVVINTQIQFQEMDGFGASDCWSFQKIGEWSESQKNHVADLLFSTEVGIGLSQWRFNIGAGINTQTINHPWRTVETFETGSGEYDWTRQEEERWFLDAAKDRGVNQFIAFVNSPPGRMTRNGLTNCTNGVGSTNLKNGWENQFARYLKDILVQFRDEWNLEFDYISPVNEPQWEWNNGSNQEGNRASNEDIHSITEALYDSLQTAGLNTEISLVESGDLRSWYQYNNGMANEYGEAYGNYLSQLINHPDISNKISPHIGGHSYWSDRINTELVQDREALMAELQLFLDDDWRYWVTEYTILDGPNGYGGNGRDLTMQTAIDVARVIHHDLTILNASSWQWWTAVSPEDYKDGLIYTNYMSNPWDHSAIESKLLWTFGNYSRFIRPGYHRIELTGADNRFGLMGSAFVSENEEILVVVFINASTISREISLDFIASDKPQTLRGYLTSDNTGDDLRDLGLIPVDSTFTIPSLSALTLTGVLGETVPQFEGYDPDKYQLYPNYPNPFKSQTNLCFNMPVSGPAEISIYSILGEEIYTVSWQNMSEGIKQYSWNGLSNRRKRLSSGVYLYTLEAGDEIHTRKMVYIQ